MIYKNPFNSKSAISHDQAREWIQTGLQGRLEPGQQSALDAHLAGCVECARYRSEMTTLDRQLGKSLPARWPERRYSAQELDRKLAGMQTRVRRNSMFKAVSSVARLGAAAVVLVMIIAGLAWVSKDFMLDPTRLGGPAADGTPAAGVGGEPCDYPNYTVKEGETLDSIAAIFTIGKGEIMRQNHITDEAISTGQVLQIPVCAQTVRMTTDAAEKLVRDWIYANNPGMNPDAAFPLHEITTEETWQRMMAQVYKVSDGVQMGQSYLVKGSTVTPIGESFGGMGVGDMVVADLDANGQPELIYAFSFGSGIHQSDVGIAVEANEAGGFTTQHGSARFLGDLQLVKDGDQSVKVIGTPTDGTEQQQLGFLRFVDGRLVILNDLGEMSTYTNERFGISFVYPSTWVMMPDEAPPAGDRFEGADGFFEIAPLDGPTDLSRACEWEANRDGDTGYGDQPEIMMTNPDGREACLILTSLSGPNARSVLLFQTPDGRIAALWTDPAHLQSISAALRFSWRPEELPQQPVEVGRIGAVGQLQTREVGGFTLEEYAVVSAAEDTPTHFEFSDRIPEEVMARHAEQRTVDVEEHIADVNHLLEPFGYRVETKIDESYRFDLYQGDILISGDLTTVFTPSVHLDEQGSNFAMIVISIDGKHWLVRNGIYEQWTSLDPNVVRPVMAGSHMLMVDLNFSNTSTTGRVILKQDGAEIFSYVTAPTINQPVKGLWSWDGGWALEVNGTLFVNGTNWNQKEIQADEIFNFHLLDGQPFFFFKRDGKINAWLNGQVLDLQYDDVVHYRCCEPAIFNPGGNDKMVWFYALKDGIWHFVQLGRFN